MAPFITTVELYPVPINIYLIWIIQLPFFSYNPLEQWTAVIFEWRCDLWYFCDSRWTFCKQFLSHFSAVYSECSFSSNVVLKALKWGTRFRHCDTFFLVNRIHLHQKENKLWSTQPLTTVLCRKPVAVFFEFRSMMCWTGKNSNVLTLCSECVALSETSMVQLKMMWRISVLLTEVLTLSPVFARALKSLRLHSQESKTSALSICYGTKECFSVTLLNSSKNPSNLGLMKFDILSAY